MFFAGTSKKTLYISNIFEFLKIVLTLIFQTECNHTIAISYREGVINFVKLQIFCVPINFLER